MNDPECLEILRNEGITKWFKFDNQAIFPKKGQIITDTSMEEALFKMAYT